MMLHLTKCNQSEANLKINTEAQSSMNGKMFKLDDCALEKPRSLATLVPMHEHVSSLYIKTEARPSLSYSNAGVCHPSQTTYYNNLNLY